MDDDDDLLDTIGPESIVDVEDLDDEMRGLIGQLDEADSEVDQSVLGDGSPPLAVDNNPEFGKNPDAIELPTIQPPIVAEQSGHSAVIAAQVDQPIVDLRKQFEQFDAVTEEVLQGARHDRQETQDAINLCRTEIDKAVGSSRDPSRMWVDNLMKALEVKATINQTAIKALDAKAKLLAATKAGIQIQTNMVNNNTGPVQADTSLIDLLSSNPLNDSAEDEY